ncbi:LysR family transcriptional regulator [Streptomyces sp. NPDC056696]|uniref:LysR family transcriptional regulator n=1 Tax=unclassified Streptomyces TaxID=2593676 RepID=UPI00367AC0A8
MALFVAVADNGGVNRAAAVLRVAQPSHRQAVRNLEKDLRTKLFHRVGRYLARALPVRLWSARQILRDVDATWCARSGTWSVAGSTSMGD